MHTTFYQLRTSDEYDEMAIYEMEDMLGDGSVDYIDEYENIDKDKEIGLILQHLQSVGCEIDIPKKSFKIVDREKFFEFLIGDKYYWDELKPDLSWLGRAKIAHNAIGAAWCKMPCVYNQCFYHSFFDAIRYDVLDDGYYEQHPQWIEIVDIYDCHF